MRNKQIINRFILGIIMVPLFIIPIILGDWVLILGLCYLLIKGVNELHTISSSSSSSSSSNLKVLLGYLIGLTVILISYIFPSRIDVIISLSILIGVILFKLNTTNNEFSSWMIIILGALYIGLFLSYAIYIRELPKGKEWLITILAGGSATDIFSYLTGKRFGKTKLAPRISPGKTWEGFAGGLIASILIEVILCSFFKLTNIYSSIVLGIFIAFADLIGDLFASMIKRTYGVKDFGAWIMKDAHGGVLDRIDGWLVVMPVAFYLLQYILEI